RIDLRNEKNGKLLSGERSEKGRSCSCYVTEYSTRCNCILWCINCWGNSCSSESAIYRKRTILSIKRCRSNLYRLFRYTSSTCIGSTRRNRFKACEDRKSTRLNSSHVSISYAVFCLKKKKNKKQ